MIFNEKQWKAVKNNEFLGLTGKFRLTGPKKKEKNNEKQWKAMKNNEKQWKAMKSNEKQWNFKRNQIFFDRAEP